jgi:hypothetical protein
MLSIDTVSLHKDAVLRRRIANSPWNAKFKMEFQDLECIGGDFVETFESPSEALFALDSYLSTGFKLVKLTILDESSI